MYLLVDFNKIKFDLVAPIFKLLAWAYDLLISFTDDSLFSSDKISLFTDSIYILVGIFMLFRLAVSMLNYLINPDSFSDKSSGGSKMLTRVVISMLLIIGSSFVFDELVTLQKNIVTTDGGIIFRIIRLNDSDGNIVSGAVDKVGDTCYPTGGSVLASTAMQAFVSGNYEKFDEDILWYFARSSGNECDAAVDDNSQKHINAVTNVEDKFNDETLNVDMLLAMIAGIAIVGFILIMAIDIVVRNLKILLLQMISPVAFVSYMNPKDKIFNQWLKNYGSVYADLFIKLIAVAFVIVLVNFLHDNTDISGFGAVFYLMGILVFAKAVPSFISKIFGIDGAGSFKESANMLKKGLGLGVAGAALTGAGLYRLGRTTAADVKRRVGKHKELKDKLNNTSNAKDRAKLRAKQVGNVFGGIGGGLLRAGSSGFSVLKGAGQGANGKYFDGAKDIIGKTGAEADAITEGATLGKNIASRVNSTFGTNIGKGAKLKKQAETASAASSSIKDLNDHAVTEVKDKFKELKDQKKEITTLNAMLEDENNFSQIASRLGFEVKRVDNAKYTNGNKVLDELELRTELGKKIDETINKNGESAVRNYQPELIKYKEDGKITDDLLSSLGITRTISSELSIKKGDHEFTGDNVREGLVTALSEADTIYEKNSKLVADFYLGKEDVDGFVDINGTKLDHKLKMHLDVSTDVKAQEKINKTMEAINDASLAGALPDGLVVKNEKGKFSLNASKIDTEGNVVVNNGEVETAKTVKEVGEVFSMFGTVASGEYRKGGYAASDKSVGNTGGKK